MQELDDKANYLCKKFRIFFSLSMVVSIHGFHREILKRYFLNYLIKLNGKICMTIFPWPWTLLLQRQEFFYYLSSSLCLVIFFISSLFFHFFVFSSIVIFSRHFPNPCNCHICHDLHCLCDIHHHYLCLLEIIINLPIYPQTF